MIGATAIAALFPVDAPAPVRTAPVSAMSEERERPFWAAVIRIVREHEATFEDAVLGCAIALFLMMAIGTTVAWQTGAWANRPAARAGFVTTVLPAPAGAAGAR